MLSVHEQPINFGLQNRRPPFRLEGVEVVSDDALETVHDGAPNSSDTKRLGHLCSLASRSRANGGLNEPMLTFPSAIRIQCEMKNLEIHLVRLALFVVVDNEAELSFGILLAVLKSVVHFQLVALFPAGSERQHHD